jgi:hypothetical protein
MQRKVTSAQAHDLSFETSQNVKGNIATVWLKTATGSFPQKTIHLISPHFLEFQEINSSLSAPTTYGARGIVVGWCTTLQPVMSRVWIPMRSLDFSIDLILPDTLLPWERFNL